MARRIFPMILLCAGTLCVSAQTTILKALDRNQYLARVKMVDEFFARFNGEEKRKDMPEEYSDSISNILLLFDLSKYKSKSDSGFVAAENFAGHVVASKSLLRYEDANWFAKIKCHAKLGQKKTVFNMFLCVEERDSAMYRWAISNVEGGIFLNSRDNPHKELFIMPNDNEQFFQSVKKATTETYKYIDDYVKKKYKADALSTFLALVRHDQLKIEAITDVQFVFLQVPDYAFTVKYFERDNKNVGWLIDSCTKMSDQEKDLLLKTIH